MNQTPKKHKAGGNAGGDQGAGDSIMGGSPTGLMSPVAPAVEVMVAKGVRDNKRLGGSSTLAGRS
jgi:hypothetical protein